MKKPHNNPWTDVKDWICIDCNKPYKANSYERLGSYRCPECEKKRDEHFAKIERYRI